MVSNVFPPAYLRVFTGFECGGLCVRRSLVSMFNK